MSPNKSVRKGLVMDLLGFLRELLRKIRGEYTITLVREESRVISKFRPRLFEFTSCVPKTYIHHHK